MAKPHVGMLAMGHDNQLTQIQVQSGSHQIAQHTKGEFCFFSKCISVCDLKLFWGVAGQTHRLVQSAVTVADICKIATKMYRGSSLLILGLYIGIYGCSSCSNVNSPNQRQGHFLDRQRWMIFVDQLDLKPKMPLSMLSYINC